MCVRVCVCVDGDRSLQVCVTVCVLVVCVFCGCVYVCVGVWVGGWVLCGYMYAQSTEMASVGLFF